MPETVTGTVEQINHWTGAKKGYFLALEDDDKDFYQFGSPSAKEGDRVTLRYKKGSKSFADKFEITGTETLTEGAPRPPAEEKAPAAPSKKDDRILKQCALKAAARFVGDTTERGVELKKEEIVKEVAYYAKAFKKIIEGL